MATKLYVRAKSGTQAIADLGITITTAWTLLSSSGPSDPEGNSGQFSAREIRDSKDLWDLITGDTIEWSKDGVQLELAADYLGDYMLMQDFTDDLLDLSSGRLVFPNGTSSPASGLEGETFWDSDDDTLWVWDGSSWVNVGATVASGVIDHGSLSGLGDDDHPQYHDGSLAYTGNLDMGGNDITNVGDVDGVDISAFYSAYLAHGPHYTDHHQLAGLGDDDHTQYVSLTGDTARNNITGALDLSGGTRFVLPQAADVSLSLIGEEGAMAWDTDDDTLYAHDGTQWIGIAPASGILTDHGALSGLTDDDHPQYTDWTHDETVSGVWTFATDTNEPAFVITPDTAAPTTKLADGAVAIIDGLLSIYDNSRSKFLSVDRQKFVAGRKGNATNIYLYGPDGIPTSQTGFRMARNGTIVALWAQTEADGNDWTFEVRNAAGAVIASLAVTTDGNQVTTTNVDVSQGDEIRMYCNGTAISSPVCGFEVAWRDT